MKKSNDEIKWMLQHCKRKSAMFGKIAPRNRAIAYTVKALQNDMFELPPEGARAMRSLVDDLTRYYGDA